jgi:hypothetical protein
LSFDRADVPVQKYMPNTKSNPGVHNFAQSTLPLSKASATMVLAEINEIFKDSKDKEEHLESITAPRIIALKHGLLQLSTLIDGLLFPYEFLYDFIPLGCTRLAFNEKKNEWARLGDNAVVKMALMDTGRIITARMISQKQAQAALED